MKKGDKRPSLFSLKGHIKTGGGHHCPVERGLVIYREEIVLALSMTGYGRGEVTTSVGTIVVEMKAVNHRYLDIAIRAPKEFNALEEDLRLQFGKPCRGGGRCLCPVYAFCRSSSYSDCKFAFSKGLFRASTHTARRNRASRPVDSRDLLTLPEVIRLEECRRYRLIASPLLKWRNGARPAGPKCGSRKESG